MICFSFDRQKMFDTTFNEYENMANDNANKLQTLLQENQQLRQELNDSLISYEKLQQQSIPIEIVTVDSNSNTNANTLKVKAIESLLSMQNKKQKLLLQYKCFQQLKENIFQKRILNYQTQLQSQIQQNIKSKSSVTETKLNQSVKAETITKYSYQTTTYQRIGNLIIVSFHI